MEFLPINDLPNELLEMIFDHLNVEDLTNASLVCRRWLDIEQRVDRVMRVPKFPWDKDLLQSPLTKPNRKYRHLELGDTKKCSAHVKELFQAFNFSSLRIKDRDLSLSSLRLILLEVPNLQQLSIVSEPAKMNKMIEPLPVMRKLEHLEISNDNLNSGRTLPWHTIAPSLQSLKMNCNTYTQLEQWRLYSGQLKQVYVTCNQVDFDHVYTYFYEMTFPLLEVLSIKLEMKKWKGSMKLRRAWFIRQGLFQLTHQPNAIRNASLRRLRLDGICISKTLVQNITNHSKKLTTLEIIGARRQYELNGEPGSLESLSQLPELKHLRLKSLNTHIFRGCGALTSLQSLSINFMKFDSMPLFGYLEDLFQIEPQLRCLELGSVVMPARAVHFICNRFTKLTHLQLTYTKVVSPVDLSRIDQLAHLWCLELHLFARHGLSISIIPQNNVRYLTLHLHDMYDEDDLLRLPEMFPQLDRLNLNSLGLDLLSLRESTLDQLRQLLPTCAIKIYGYLITNTGMKKCFPKWTRSEMMPVWEREW